MKLISVAFAVAVLLASVWPTEADARHRHGHFSFGFYGPGIDIFVGRPYYRPYRSYRRAFRACRKWSRRCSRNWGYGRDFHGCMRYHGC